MGDRSRWAGLALCLALLGCEPFIGFAGGRLSGTVAAPPDDWGVADAVDTFQIETRPEDPYSVNVWAVAIGADLYVGTSPDTTWAQHIARDPKVRLRAGETLYELRAERAEAASDRDAFWAAVAHKYEYEPDAEQRSGGIFFRLVPR